MTKVDKFFTLLCMLYVVSIYGAIPFLMSPTTHQPLWISGFAQSLANHPYFTIYATNFGAPHPAPVTFGLAGVLLESFFLRLGMEPYNAYALMYACWVVLAFYGAWKIALLAGLSPRVSSLAAVLWCCLPINVVHITYSMLGTAFSLIPFFFYSFWLLLNHDKKLLGSLIFFISVFICTFLDGYTFVMFSLGSGVLWLLTLLSKKTERKRLLFFVAPVMMLSFLFSIIIYTKYLGVSKFVPSDLDIFRAWGLDLKFLAIPTSGKFILYDFLGLSELRSQVNQFGDESIWYSTYLIPMIVAAVIFVIFLLKKKRTAVVISLIIIALFAFYMSLGPSLKINSVKPPQVAANEQYMPSEYAVMPTGSAILSNFPGFESMRATYRWIVLFAFASWALIILGLGQAKIPSRLSLIILTALIVLNCIDPLYAWQARIQSRNLFVDIENKVVADLRPLVSDGEMVAFLPKQDNDFVVNYFSARTGIISYNIGGDKNNEIARNHWPEDLPVNILWERAYTDDVWKELGIRIAKFMVNHPDTVVIVPFINLYIGLNDTNNHQDIYIDSEDYSNLFDSSDAIVPYEKERLSTVINIVKQELNPEIHNSKYFTSLRMDAGVDLIDIMRDKFSPEILIGNMNLNSIWHLKKGWYTSEPTHVWTSDNASFYFVLPEDYMLDKSSMTVQFVAHASAEYPISVDLKLGNEEKTLTLNNNKLNIVEIPIKNAGIENELLINVTGAVSPKAISDSSDERILGIGVQKIIFNKLSSDEILAEAPSDISVNTDNSYLPLFLTKGWYAPENGHVWSKKTAELKIPAVKGNKEGSTLELSISVPDSPRSILLSLQGTQWRKVITIDNNKINTIIIPLPATEENFHRLEITIDKLYTPINDARSLGFALHRIKR